MSVTQVRFIRHMQLPLLITSGRDAGKWHPAWRQEPGGIGGLHGDNYCSYNAGEIAGFEDPRKVAALVEVGAVEIVEAP